MAGVTSTTDWSWQYPLVLQQLQAPGQTLSTKTTQVSRRRFHGWIERGLKAEGNSSLFVGLSFHNGCAIAEHARQGFKVEIQGVDPLEGIRSLGFPLDQQLEGLASTDRRRSP